MSGSRPDGVTIRRALPEDVAFIAWVILGSQRGHRPRGWFDIALGLSEADCLSFIRGLIESPLPSLWHLSRFWVAASNGEPAAALCALPVAALRDTTRPAMDGAMKAFGLDAVEQAAVWRRGAYIRLCWTPGDDRNWLIEHVATHPSYRGLGLAKALLERALEEGQAAGFHRASIPFYIGNVAAERCYTQVGFELAEEKRDAAFEKVTGAAGFRLFERALG